MTGAAVPFLEGFMPYRVKEAFFRTAVGIMATVAGVGSGLYLFMLFDKFGTGDRVAIRTEPASFFGEHPRFIGTMGLMALQTVFDCGGMDNPFTPVLGNFVMTAQTDDRLPLFEDMVMRRTMGCMTGDTVFINCRFMRDLGVLDGLANILVAFQAELTGFFLDDKGIVGGMGRVAVIAFTFGHRGVGLYGLSSLLNGLMAGSTECAIFVVGLEKLLLLGSMELMAAGAVCRGKRLVEAESSPFIGLLLVAGEAERSLRGEQKVCIGRFMGQMAGVASLFGGSRMADAAATISLRFMTSQTEGFFIMFELRLADRTVTVMTGKALAFKHRLVAAEHLCFWLLPFILLGNGTGVMAAEADSLSRLRKQQPFIAGMNRMTADALFVQVRFVGAARSAHRFFMTGETEFIGRSFGDNLVLFYLVTGITLPFAYGLVQIFLQKTGGIARMRRMALQASALNRVIKVGPGKGLALCLVTGTAACVWFIGQ